MAFQLNLDGIYIPSFNKSMVQNIYSKTNKFSIIGSAHNIKEIREKEKQGVNRIFISPLFNTKKKIGLEIVKFNNLSKYTKKKTIALGGINVSNIKKLKLTKIVGFASISYIDDFYK